MFKKLRALATSNTNASISASLQLEEIQSKFLLHKTTFHGFPPNPTCLAHDPIWSLLFIGTSTGQIYMYGTPGLEIKTEHPDYPINFSPIQHLFPLPEQMELISICENNMLHVWSICDEENNAQLAIVNQKELIQGRGKEITACCVRRNCVYFGTGDGRLYQVEIQFMGITSIDWEEGGSTPVVSLEICPTDANFMLCGYKNGVVSIRNVKQGISIYTVQRKDLKDNWGLCHLTGVTWQHTGDGFLASYSNGEIAYWTVSNRGTPDFVNTFFESEFSLEAITKPIWTSGDLLVFSGGIPEDIATQPMSTITLAQAREPDTLELTSPIVSPTPDSCSSLQETDIDSTILRDKDAHLLQEPIPSVVEAIRSSSPYSTTSTLDRKQIHSTRHSGFYPDCGDITLEKLKSLAINQNFDGTECDFTSEEFTGFQINIDHPSPVKEIDTPLDTPQTPEHTPNGPDSTEDSFLTAKNESFDLSNLELGKISREMEDFLAEFASGEEKSMPSVSREVRTSGEASNGTDNSEQIGDITETLLTVGDFTRDEDKYIKENGELSDDVTDKEVVLREKHVQISENTEVREIEIVENGEEGLEGLELFENEKFMWRDSTIHEETQRNVSSPHESDLDEVIDSIERLVSRPWVKKMNPWKNEEKRMVKFTSTIKGFFVIKQDEYTARWMRATSPSPVVRNEILVALLDQEILFIDLTKPDYPLVMPPYLTNLHSSPVTCSLMLDTLASVEYKLLKQLGAAQINQLYASTNMEWPFTGGEVREEFCQDLTVIFITGHENGTVRFWDITGGSISLIYCLYTNYLFDLGADRATPAAAVPENQIDSVQRGFFDPYAEDCRFKVTSLSCYDTLLAVGGAGGQVLLFELTHELVTPQVFQLEGVLLDEEVRMRHRPSLQPLHFKPPHDPDRGYVPIFFFQMSPASPITTLEMAHKFSLVAVGCSYGLAVMDLEKRSIIFTHTTFIEGQVPDESSLNRRNSMRQSFRQSFRNLRRAGSGRRSRTVHSSIRGRPSTRGGPISGRGSLPTLPVSQQSPQGNSLTVVRCLTFTTTFISGNNAQLCLWAGTSEGSVIRMSISVPSKGNRKNRITEVHLIGKPLYLRRASPLTRITVLDAANQVQLPVGAKGVKGPHTVLMCSEDYIKIMNLPGMKKKSKERLRLDENDVLRLIRTELLNVNGVMCLTTLDSEGQISVYSLPDMRLLYRIPILEPTDFRAQKSLCMTPSGLIIAQSSQLQFQKYSLIEISRYLRIATIGESICSPRSEKSAHSFHSHKLL